MKKILVVLLALPCLLLVPALSGLAGAHEHGAHVHGAAEMTLAIEEQLVEIGLETPLDNVLSFEHSPQSESEKQEVKNMAAALRKAELLFVFPVEARCEVKEVELSSEAISAELLSGKDGGAGAESEGHADLDAEFSFLCRNPEAIKRIEVNLFKYFPKLQEVEVQMVTPAGQKAAELNPEDNILEVAP
jgi:hypothetical protein